MSTLIIASLCGWAIHTAPMPVPDSGPLSEALRRAPACLAPRKKIARKFDADADFDRRPAGLVQAKIAARADQHVGVDRRHAELLRQQSTMFRTAISAAS